MLISEVLTPSLIKLNVEAKTKEELFEEMVQLFVSAGIIADREAAVMALIEREQKMSTGIAPDFALPHGKIMGIKGVVMALGIIRDGMDFDSLDDEPVHVVLTLFSEVGLFRSSVRRGRGGLVFYCFQSFLNLLDDLLCPYLEV